MRSRLRRFTDGLPRWVWPSRERRVRRWLRAGRRWRKKHPPRCYRCGFNLTGSRHLETCPECGRACEWRAHWTRDGRWSMRFVVILWFAVFLLWMGSMFGAMEYEAHLRRATTTLTILGVDLAWLTFPIGLFGGAIIVVWCSFMVEWRTRAFTNQVRRQIAFTVIMLAVSICVGGVAMLTR